MVSECAADDQQRACCFRNERSRRNGAMSRVRSSMITWQKGEQDHDELFHRRRCSQNLLSKGPSSSKANTYRSQGENGSAFYCPRVVVVETMPPAVDYWPANETGSFCCTEASITTAATSSSSSLSASSSVHSSLSSATSSSSSSSTQLCSNNCCCTRKKLTKSPLHQVLFGLSRQSAATFFIYFILILSTLPNSSTAYDASYSVVQQTRTSHICFIRPTEAREDRVAVERWFFNATSRNCETYQLELNMVDTGSRNLLNDFATYRACHRFCYRVVKNLTDAEIQHRSREGLVYVNSDDERDGGRARENFAPAPTIIVSNFDAKARREHASSSSNSMTRRQGQDDGGSSDAWSASSSNSVNRPNAIRTASSATSFHPQISSLVLLLEFFFFFLNFLM